MQIKVLVNGASGKMGQEVCKAITQHEALELVQTTDVKDDLISAIKRSRAQVVVDFTTASVALQNAQTIIEHGVHPVIGTTGFTPQQIDDLKTLCQRKKLGGIIAPNFSIGAVLMMKYAQDAAKYFPQVEIIEFHHDSKADSPSGTALRTSELIAESRSITPNSNISAKLKEIVPGARGAENKNIHIHSVRLPGLIAHQEVIFGDKGQSLTIRHDSFHRESFMPGVCLACQKVLGLKELVHGLEHILG